MKEVPPSLLVLYTLSLGLSKPKNFFKLKKNKGGRRDPILWQTTKHLEIKRQNTSIRGTRLQCSCFIGKNNHGKWGRNVSQGKGMHFCNYCCITISHKVTQPVAGQGAGCLQTSCMKNPISEQYIKGRNREKVPLLPPSCLLFPVYQTNTMGVLFLYFWVGSSGLFWQQTSFKEADLVTYVVAFYGIRSGGRVEDHTEASMRSNTKSFASAASPGAEGPGDRWGQENLMRPVGCVLYEISYYHTYIS